MGLEGERDVSDWYDGAGDDGVRAGEASMSGSEGRGPSSRCDDA